MKTLKHIFALLFLLAPFIAEACSVCGGANSPQQTSAYLQTTVLLAGMPIGIGAAVFFWIYSKSKRANAEANSVES